MQSRFTAETQRTRKVSFLCVLHGSVVIKEEARFPQAFWLSRKGVSMNVLILSRIRILTNSGLSDPGIPE
jgi:hypothetical protein